MKKEYKVLDFGLIRLVSLMGDDESIVKAARVSYDENTKTSEEDEKLIRYLMKNKHTTPFEHVVFTFHIKMPLFIARQWVRHRTASINEISARYTVMQDEFYIPETNKIFAQHYKRKQCGADILTEDNQDAIRKTILANSKICYKNYKHALKMGCSKEQARMMLPLNIYTQMYWTINLHNLLHFIELRIHEHSQFEIREYAHRLLYVVNDLCPWACSAFEDFRLNKRSNNDR